MKSEILKEEGLKRKIKIVVEASEVQAEFEKFYSQVKKSANIKGFRKGKVPLSKLKSLYGAQAAEEVLKNLLSQFYYEALNEQSLEPIGRPHFHFEKLKEDKGFEFSAEFEIRPTVYVKNYEGLEVEKERLEVTEKSLEEVIEKIRESRGSEAPILEDRPACLGDIAKIDFEGSVEGTPIEGASGKDHPLDLGSQSFIEGFEGGVVGMKVGDKKELHLKFPSHYQEPSLSGKDVLFKVELKALSKKDLPELNDEFAKTLGKYNTLDELRAALKVDIVARESHRIEQELKDRMLKVLVEKNPVETPHLLYEEQKKKLVEDAQKRLKKQGMSDKDFEVYKNKWDENFGQSAKFMIQSAFLIDALAKEHHLFAQEKDIKEKMKAHSDQANISLEEIEKFYADEDKMSHLSFQLTEERVLGFLVSKAKISEVSANKFHKPQE